MNDSETRALAAQLAKAQDTRTRALIDERLRDYLGTGVPSGTYGTFTWDGRRIVWAGDGAGGAASLIVAHTSATYVAGPSETIRINFDTVDHDPASRITTGDDWAVTAPGDGWYQLGATVLITEGADTPLLAGEALVLLLMRFDSDGDLITVMGTLGYCACGVDETLSRAVFLGGVRVVPATTATQSYYLEFINNSAIDRSVEAGGQSSAVWMASIGPGM